MSPVLHICDMVMVCNNNGNGTSFENIRIGDIVVFNAFAADAVDEGITIVSRVAAMFEESETLMGNAKLDQLCTRFSTCCFGEQNDIDQRGRK
ncbi:MAG: S26 family signal peptidase [Thermoproteota archaeon]|nr:S26 family signal peptidase [Thermoproteota archaeon]